MGIAGVAGGVAAAASVASAANSIANSGSSGGGSAATGTQGGNPATYIPTGQPQADANYQNLLAQLQAGGSNLTSSVIPQLQGYTGALLSTTSGYPALAQTGANQAYGYGTNTLAPNQAQGAAGLQNLGNTIGPYGQTILNTGFDPQNALYNRTAQNVLGESAVANAQAGVQGPYAAGVTGANLNNFNIDWQNAQLGRQLQALQGYGSVVNSAGRGYAGASDLGGAAMGTLSTAGALPQQEFMNLNNADISALNNLVSSTQGAYGLDINALQGLSSYLSLGQGSSALAQAGQRAGFTQGQTLGSNLGAGLSSLANNTALQNGLSNLFGSGAGSGSYDPYSSSAPSFLGGYGSYGGFSDVSSANDIAGFAGGFG